MMMINKKIQNIVHTATSTIFQFQQQQQQQQQQQFKRLFSNSIHQKFIQNVTCSFTNSRNQNYSFHYQLQNQIHYQYQPFQYKRTHFTYSDGPGTYDNDVPSSSSVSSEQQLTKLEQYWSTRNFNQRGFTVGIGGPVGSGKTALVLQLCQNLYSSSLSNNDNDDDSDSSDNTNIYATNLAVVTNDIFTQEDCEFLIKHNALPKERIVAVETGGCPHAAIREDISANLSSLEYLTKLHYQQPTNDKSNTTNKLLSNQPILLLCESGGDNLAANFSRELADIIIYVIDVAGGDKVPRKGGPGITQSDLLLINKIDLATAVGANLDIMKHDANTMRQYKSKTTLNNTNTTTEETSIQYGPTYFCSIKNGIGIPEIIQFIQTNHQRALQVSSDSTNLQIQVQHTGSHNHDDDHHHHNNSSTSTSSSHNHSHDHK